MATGDGAAGHATGAGGEGADAGVAGGGEDAGEGVDGVFVRGEGDDWVAGVIGEDVADQGGAVEV
ncbi:MAG TPA: hypothetical protein VNW46_15820, partial [Gemmatimonadaceae bacterium]|nr:hypothetical protein [Gemmatimonadaceae bacterium]